MIVQLLLNSLIAANIIMLIALSFSVIYSVNRFFHFTHAVIFTSGAYFALLFNQWIGWSLLCAVPAAVICSSILGSSIELVIYKPLRRKKSSSLILLLSSLGIYIVLQNIISILFGDDTKSIRTWPVVEGMSVFGARITPVQIIIIVASIILLVVTYSFMNFFKMGKTMRAVANDPELANISGININKVILTSFVIGSALGGLAGVLVSLDIDMAPTMGMNALMLGIVAMIIGGIGSIRGIILGSLLIALAQNIGVWYVSSQWQDAIVFAILLIFLLIKPEGFFGKKLKKATI